MRTYRNIIKDLMREQAGGVLNDCIHIKIHRKCCVDTEAFYILLDGKENKNRKVLCIYNKPTESAFG